MSLFNSLGSNYSAGFSLRSLVAAGSRRNDAKIRKLIATKYEVPEDQVALTYKGRHALELALKTADLPKNSKVAINGYTCYVVYEAVIKAGYQPVFVDVAEDALDFNEVGLAAAFKKDHIKAVIVQNTLGRPVNMSAIEKLCQQHKALVIEDLAHSFGARYADGRATGTVGDFVMMSFSQDKPLDVVAGGAVIARHQTVSSRQLPAMRAGQQLKNQCYPFWTALIRGTYSLGIGRVLHATLRRLHWMATPMSDDVKQMYAMTPAAEALLINRWPAQEDELKHRRLIARVYQENLPSEVLFAAPNGSASFLRFPIHVTDRAGLVAHLKKQAIYIGDTWYDAPIGPKKYLAKTDYKSGECPNAEKLAAEMVNLPTHQHVTPEKAHAICATIRQWQTGDRRD